MEVKLEQWNHDFDHLLRIFCKAFLQFASVTHQHLTSSSLFFQTSCSYSKTLLMKRITTTENYTKQIQTTRKHKLKKGISPNSSELGETIYGQQGMEVTWSPTVTNCHSVSLSMSLISSPVKRDVSF